MAAPPVDDKVREALTRPQSVIDITTTGRKSGKPRRLEIVLDNIDDRLYISGAPSRTRRGWLANLEGDPNLTIHLKRGVVADLPATAREITDPVGRGQVFGGSARHWNRGDVDVMMQYSPLIEVEIQSTETGLRG